MPRVGLALAIACVSLALSLTGCSDAFNAGPLEYVENEALTKEVRGKSQPGEKPDPAGQSSQGPQAPLWRLAAAHQGAAGLGPAAGGLYLASYMQEGEGAQAKYRRLYRRQGRRIADADSRTANIPTAKPQAGRLCPVSPQLPALSWRFRRRRRAHRTVSLSLAARLSQGNLQVHVHAQRQAAAPQRPAAHDLQRPARHVDAGVSLADDAAGDRAGHRLCHVPEHARRDRARS